MTDDRFDPDVIRAWIRVGRDIAFALLGSAMLIWETVFAPAPDPMIIAAALVVLGLPPALRIDEAFQRRGGGEDR